jgi:hypothetical protein
MGNFDANLSGRFKLSFVVTNVSNLDANIDSLYVSFRMVETSNFFIMTILDDESTKLKVECF